MTLGIKVGPQKQSFQDLEQTNAPFAEVWFNIVKKDDVYPELFTELKMRKMAVGLHFWGHLPDGTWTNIALDDQSITQSSMLQFQETIDIAAQNKFQYVNIHPSTMAKVHIDLDNESFTVMSEPLAKETAERIFLENYALLDAYAKTRGVVLTVETVPLMDSNGWKDPQARLTPFSIYSLPNATVVKAAQMGFTVANDFGHTTCTTISDDRSKISQILFTMTHELRSQTRLLHLGYVLPPYNGTDIHDHLDNPLFETDQPVPNKKEMIELLKLFKDRDDVWALVEPNGRHVKNFFLAKQLLENLS